MYEAQYFDLALEDLKQAKTWYKEQKDGLEIDFANAIKQTIEKVLQMPTAFAVRYRNVRIAHTPVFPYNVHFYIDEKAQTIVFTAFIHNKREDALRVGR